MYVRTYVCTLLCTRTYVCIYVYVCMHIRVYVCMYVCMYVCITRALNLFITFKIQTNMKCWKPRFFVCQIVAIYIVRLSNIEDFLISPIIMLNEGMIGE
jgi:hypothetical protein